MKKHIIWDPPSDNPISPESYRTFREGEVIGEGFCSGGRWHYEIRGQESESQPTQKENPTMTTEQEIREKLGPPYEDDGCCETCNANGPTWEAEEPITFNRLPFCANCMKQLLENQPKEVK